MSAPTGFEFQSVQLSLRFIRGYRYLDRCGECLVRLEDVLEDGWIPSEASPTSGTMRNEPLGMGLIFNSEGMNVRQSEYMAFEEFADQACKIYETVWRVLGIERISAPSLVVFYQKGFDEDQEDDAERYLLEMKICRADEELLKIMGGLQSAVQHTIVTRDKAQMGGSVVQWRRRLQANVVKQVRQQNFDARFLQRSRALGPRQGDAIRAMLKLRKLHPQLSPFAVQLELEGSLDMDLSTKEFDMRQFIFESKDWAERVKGSPVLRQGV